MVASISWWRRTAFDALREVPAESAKTAAHMICPKGIYID
jgi:hypothetical protein